MGLAESNPSKRSDASERARLGWHTRRNNGVCASCGRVGVKLYAVPDLHPDRDLCLDCAWRIGEKP